MSKKYADLSKEQQSAFQHNCDRFGLCSDDLERCDDAFNRGGPRIVSSRPDRGTVPVLQKKLVDVNALKRLGGYPNERYISGKYSDAFVDYPPPLPEWCLETAKTHAADLCLMEAELGESVRKDVTLAMRAFVMGNSNKVSEYEELINTLHFPMNVAIAGTKDIVITKDDPLIIDNPDGPTELVFATMTIKKGGFIEVKTPAQIDAINVVKEA